MSYQEAFAAFNEGDYPTAVALLGKAARDTGYSSDFINHAYTLALYHTGDKTRLADVSFQIGDRLAETDRASAMDYFQRAMVAGLDANRTRRIGEFIEECAVSRGDTADGRRTGSVNHVAHVVGSLLPDDPRTAYLKMLVAGLREQGIASTIFTTEWAASWFFNSAPVPQSQAHTCDAPARIASVEGDFEERARRVAKELQDSNIGVALFHSSLVEQITARAASLRAAPLQVNVNHGFEMHADLFDASVYLEQRGHQESRSSKPSVWIPIASDIETRLEGIEAVSRLSIGLESASSISATFGDLRNVAGQEYLRALAEIMKRFPNHFHLFAGPGSVKAVRTYLHSEGVLPRVRFLGNVGDVAGLLGMVDVYLAAFPRTDAKPILDAMGTGTPVVALRNSGAELVGIRDLAAPGAADYVEIADRLLRNAGLREQQAPQVLQRFRSEFRPGRLGERYKAFLESLLNPR